jgi:AcrR family transcriptional regulator
LTTGAKYVILPAPTNRSVCGQEAPMTEQETKAQILAAATAVLAQKGFTKASMNDIVQASGLSKGGVYWHFKSKDDIIMAIFDQFFTGQLTMLDMILAGDGSASEKLMKMAHFTGDDMEAAFAQFPSPLEFYALAARDDFLAHLIETFFDKYHQKLTALIQQGIDDGEFRQVPVKETTNTILSLFEGILLIWAVHPAAMELGPQVEMAIQLLLDGLRK